MARNVQQDPFFRAHRAGFEREPRPRWLSWLRAWLALVLAFWGVIGWAIIELVQWVTTK